MRILLVEDDPDMRAVMVKGLSQAGFTVDWACDGHSGLRQALTRHYGILVLDLMLPGITGGDICRILRENRRQTPILMVTARDLVEDRVAGLESGADDYLPKPFDFRELLARVRALARRDRVLKAGAIRIGDVEVDTEHRTVTRDSRIVPLTRTEYDIFEILAAQCGRTVRRERLLELVWQDTEPGSNKLEVTIRSLRRKIGAGGAAPLIHTVHGFGYAVRTEPETTT
jgi:DNA-binding response OmpR family regulator